MSKLDRFENLPPIPEEVSQWNDSLIELFCDLSIRNISRGYSPEEADQLAMDSVKKHSLFRERT